MLKKHFFNNFNQLLFADDPVGSVNGEDLGRQSSGNYTYDNIGNLVSDAAEQIAHIDWTVYGKVKRVIRTTGSTKPDLEFAYDANGNRIMKRAGGDYTYYSRDAQGNIMAIYDKKSVTSGSSYEDQYMLKEHLLYGSSRLGVKSQNLMLERRLYDYQTATYSDNLVTFGDPAYHTRELGKKHYELTDHLGNVNMTITDRAIAVDDNSDNAIDYYTADISSASEYFPGGMVKDGRDYSSTGYRYGAFGDEKDNEVKGNGNHLSFGNYGYDPRIIRRWNVDPLTKHYTSQSPYACFNGNPIVFKDPTGKGGIVTNVQGSPGNYTGTLVYTLVLYPGASGLSTSDLCAKAEVLRGVFLDRFPTDGSIVLNRVTEGEGRTKKIYKDVKITKVDFKILIITNEEYAEEINGCNEGDKDFNNSKNFFFIEPNKAGGFGGVNGGYIGENATSSTAYEEMLHTLGVKHDFWNFNSPLFIPDFLSTNMSPECSGESIENINNLWEKGSPKNEFSLNYGNRIAKNGRIGNYKGMDNGTNYSNMNLSDITKSIYNAYNPYISLINKPFYSAEEIKAATEQLEPKNPTGSQSDVYNLPNNDEWNECDDGKR